MAVIREDVIAAIASSAGACARIVLRLSGPGSHAVLSRIARGELPSRGVARVMLDVQELHFAALVLLFQKGASYTGEESAELHLPGNPLLARLTLEHLYHCGARPAEPGEFTARAFFNGVLDLTGAEAVAAVIGANNQRELDAARKLGAGELTRRLRPLMDQLTQALALVEAGIDFSEEDIRFISADQVRGNASEAAGVLQSILSASGRFERLSHEPLVVLCGKPNAGKSTLLNALAGKQRAIVSPVAGTTRDLLSAEVELPHGLVKIVDTAGLENTSDDSLAAQMRAQALSAIEQADVLVLVRDAGDSGAAPGLPREPAMVVHAKCDLAAAPSGNLAVSAVTGHGMTQLRDRLNELAFASAGDETLALNARHVAQIRLALDELAALSAGAISEDELAAEHLRAAIDALGEITGMVSTDDLLGRIFSTFCIGK